MQNAKCVIIWTTDTVNLNWTLTLLRSEIKSLIFNFTTWLQIVAKHLNIEFCDSGLGDGGRGVPQQEALA